MADLVTLADAKAFLNITSTNQDTELGSFITSASDMITNRVGPVAGSPTFDEWYDGGSTRIVLRHTPVQSITSITESYGSTTYYTLTAQALDGGGGTSAYGYTVDLTHGIVTRRAAGIAVPFAAGQQNVHVVYVGGYSSTPAELQLATNLLIQHMWATQRGGAKRPGLGGNDGPPPSEWDGFPPRVEEILANFYTPGIA